MKLSASEVTEKLVGRDGIEPPTPGFSVLAVNPRIVRHFIELCFTARGGRRRVMLRSVAAWSRV
jgi:hypothetical protein